MLYEEKEIMELIKCPCCQNKYTDPRIVECSSSFCMPCIDLLKKNGENGFKCPKCDDFHEMPHKGYIKNSTLAKLCNKQAELKQISDKKTTNTNKLAIGKLKVHQMPDSSYATEPMAVKVLYSGKTAVAHYNDRRDKLEIAVFDEDFCLLNQGIGWTGAYSVDCKLTAMESSSQIILCLNFRNKRLENQGLNTVDEDYCDDENTLSVVKRFDEKLNVMNKIWLDYCVGSIDTHESQLFCLSSDPNSNSCSLYIYNKNLVFLKRIGQSRAESPFYFPKSVSKMLVSENFFVLKRYNEIIVMDRDDGSIKTNFDFFGSDFFLNKVKSSILEYEQGTDELISYDFDGKSQILKLNMSDPNGRIKLVDCCDGKLLFLDAKANSLYFLNLTLKE